MKLQTKIVFSVLSVLIISLAFIGTLVFSNSKADLEKQINNQLLSVSKINAEKVNTFIDGQRNKVELIATQSELSDEELKEMVLLDDSFYDLFVIDSTGKVIASSNPARIGLDRSNRSYFFNARNQTFVSSVYFALVTQEYSVSVSTPFRDGVLVGAIKISKLAEIVSSREGLGETGETLMAFVNERGEAIYFGKRLFSDKTMEFISLADISERAITPALNDVEGLQQGYKDYRDVRVLSATKDFSDLKIGMVTKIDQSEAFADINSLQKITYFLVFLSIILIAFIIFILIRQVSREIADVTSDVEKITKGDLNVQLKKSGIEEIQGLIDSLNRILASMKLAILRTGVGKEELGLGEAIKAKEEAETRYKILYDTSADAIMTLEPPSWKFTGANLATLKMFGAKSEDDFKSKGPWDVSPVKQPDGKPSSVGAKKMIEKAMKEGKAYFDWTHKKLNGEEFSAKVLLTRVKEDGKTYLQATVRDVSQQTGIEASHEQYKVLFENADDQIFSIDKNLKYLSANKTTLLNLGKKENELIGKSIYEVYSRKVAEQFEKNLRHVLKTGKTLLVDEQIKLPKGVVQINTKLTPIKDKNGKVEFILGIVREKSRVKNEKIN